MFDNILLFFKSLTFMDYILFFTVIFLIILVICLIYFLRANEEVFVEEKKKTEEIKKEINKMLPTFTSFEEEQEKNSIISYDELLNTGTLKLNYLDEEEKDDLIVKQIDNNSLNVVSNDLNHEEEFLGEIKKIKKNLL